MLPSELLDSVLPMLLLPQQLVDVIIEISDAELSQTRVLDGGDRLGDLADDLVSPSLRLLDIVTLTGQEGSPLRLLGASLLLLLHPPPPGQGCHGLLTVTSHCDF